MEECYIDAINPKTHGRQSLEQSALICASKVACRRQNFLQLWSARWWFLLFEHRGSYRGYVGPILKGCVHTEWIWYEFENFKSKKISRKYNGRRYHWATSCHQRSMLGTHMLLNSNAVPFHTLDPLMNWQKLVESLLRHHDSAAKPIKINADAAKLSAELLRLFISGRWRKQDYWLRVNSNVLGHVFTF